MLRPGQPMIHVDWSALIGTAATMCSALSFVPQVVKVRRQGGRDLAAGTLVLLLTGALLWFTYGLLNHATSVVVANAFVIALVATIAIMKARENGERRLRVAIDMDEVIADSLAEHLRRYNAAYGTNLAECDVQGRYLEDCIPPAHRAAAVAMLDASFFEDLAVMPDSR